jgi:actin-related protein
MTPTLLTKSNSKLIIEIKFEKYNLNILQPGKNQ